MNPDQEFTNTVTLQGHLPGKPPCVLYAVSLIYLNAFFFLFFPHNVNPGQNFFSYVDVMEGCKYMFSLALSSNPYFLCRTSQLHTFWSVIHKPG